MRILGLVPNVEISKCPGRRRSEENLVKIYKAGTDVMNFLRELLFSRDFRSCDVGPIMSNTGYVGYRHDGTYEARIPILNYLGFPLAENFAALIDTQE